MISVSLRDRPYLKALRCEKLTLIFEINQVKYCNLKGGVFLLLPTLLAFPVPQLETYLDLTHNVGDGETTNLPSQFPLLEFRTVIRI